MAEKASNLVQYYENPNGPTIGTVSRKIIEKDGLYFKDLDGSGEYSSMMTGGCLPPSVQQSTSKP